MCGVVLILVCAALAVIFPDYTLYFVLFPSLVGILLFMLNQTWKENLFLILIGPIVLMALLAV